MMLDSIIDPKKEMTPGKRKRICEQIMRGFEANLAGCHAERKWNFTDLSKLSLDELKQIHEDRFGDEQAAMDFYLKAYRERMEAAAMAGHDGPVS